MPNQFSNFFIRTIVRSPFHVLLGENLAVISMVGWKTGRKVSTPINVWCQDDGWIILSLRSRTWWRNLRGGRTAQLRVAGKQVGVRGDIVESREGMIAGLTDVFHRHPQLARYFDVPLDAEGKPDPASLEREARKRVYIRLFPA